MDSVVPDVEEELEILNRLREVVAHEVDTVRAQLEPQYLEEMVARGVDRELAQAAFEERFEEAKLARMREDIPKLLPEEQRPEFLESASSRTAYPRSSCWPRPCLRRSSCGFAWRC